MSALFAASLPAKEAAALDRMLVRVRRVLAVTWPGREVVEWTHADAFGCVALVTLAGGPFGAPLVRHGTLTAVQAGYFFDEAPDADPAVASVVPALVRGGWRALPTGDGVFAFAAWDASTRTLTAGVDKLGMRPLYEALPDGGGLLVGSEPKLLIAALDGAAPNWAAIEDLQRLRCMIGDHTPFVGIRRIARAEIVECTERGITRHVAERFLEGIAERVRPDADVIEENHDAFLRVMRRSLALPGAASPVLTLSGGLDSRRLLAGLLHLGVRPAVLTVPNVRGDDTEVESGIVRVIARHLGLAVHVIANRSEAALVPLLAARDAMVDFETAEHILYAAIAAAPNVVGQLNFDGLAGDTLLNPAHSLVPKYLAPGGVEVFLREKLQAPPTVRLPGDREPYADRVHAAWNACRDDRNAFTIFAFDQRARRTVALGPMTVQARAFESVYPFVDRALMLSALSLPAAARVGRLWQRELTERLGIPGLSALPSTRNSRDVLERGITRRVDGWARRADNGARRELLAAAATVGAPSMPRRERLAAVAAAAVGNRIGDGRVRRVILRADELRRARQLGAVTASAASHLAYLERACTPLATGALAVEALDV